MSDNNISNEQDLWDVLNEPISTEPKKTKPQEKSTSRPRTGPKFAKPGPILETAPGPEGKGRRFDDFFFACMTGVAALSVAATVLIGGMTQNKKAPAENAATSPVGLPSQSAVDTSALEQENAELRQQVALQKQQIQELRAQLLDLGSTAGEVSTDTSEPDAQTEAYDIFHQIQAAYDDFDRETLERLIPRMNELLSYLSNDALIEYYNILEYVEQPGNG